MPLADHFEDEIDVQHGFPNLVAAGRPMDNCEINEEGRQCENRGVWAPMIEVSSDGRAFARGTLMNLLVCEDHQAKMGFDDLVGDEGWAQICRAFLAFGTGVPDRKYTRFTWQEWLTDAPAARVAGTGAGE